MKQVQVPPFELILSQDVATASGNPLEYLPAPKTAKNRTKIRKMGLGPGPPWGPRALVWSLNICSSDVRALLALSGANSVFVQGHDSICRTLIALCRVCITSIYSP